MASFLMQFYEGVPPPKTILVDREPEECALLSEALGESANRTVEIRVPQRGHHRRLLEQAVRNAGERSGERRGGIECFSTWTSRRPPTPYKNTDKNTIVTSRMSHHNAT